LEGIERLIDFVDGLLSLRRYHSLDHWNI